MIMNFAEVNNSTAQYLANQSRLTGTYNVIAYNNTQDALKVNNKPMSWEDAVILSNRLSQQQGYHDLLSATFAVEDVSDYGKNFKMQEIPANHGLSKSSKRKDSKIEKF